MQNFKKNLGFNLALIAIALLFAGGCVLAFMAYQASAATSLALDRARKDQSGLLRGHIFVPGTPEVSLDDENVRRAADDVKELEAHVASLRTVIAGNPELAIKGRASAN